MESSPPRSPLGVRGPCTGTVRKTVTSLRGNGGVPAIGPRPPTPQPSAEPSGSRRPSWRWSRGSGRWWRPSWRCDGHPSRSPAGCRWPTPKDPGMWVSHETIYLSLFIQSRGAPRHQLHYCLRTGRAMRYPRAKRLPQGRGQLRDIPHISQRPPGGDRPGGARPLGRRPGLRQAAQRGRDPGRAPQPLCAAVSAPGESDRPTGAAGADRRGAAAARAAAPLVTWGSGSGDGRAHPVHH